MSLLFELRTRIVDLLQRMMVFTGEETVSAVDYECVVQLKNDIRESIKTIGKSPSISVMEKYVILPALREMLATGSDTIKVGERRQAHLRLALTHCLISADKWLRILSASQL